jgi:hypothetical protein
VALKTYGVLLGVGLLALLARAQEVQDAPWPSEWLPLAEWRGATAVARTCAPATDNTHQALQVARLLALRDLARLKAGATLEGVETLRRKESEQVFSQDLRETVRGTVGPVRVARQAVWGEGSRRHACIELHEMPSRGAKKP